MSDGNLNNSSQGLANLKAGFRVTWVGVAVNIILIVFKLWAGLASRSQALIADGIHSISDLFGDFVVLLGLRWGRKREDEDHQFGHARIETISSMIVGLLLILVGMGLVYNALNVVYSQESSIPSLFAVYAAIISIVLKEALYWYTLAVGKRLRSPALIGNAWHHRTDALSSIAVLVGVGSTYINPDWYLADAYAAMLVTIFILKVGIRLVWEAFKELSDTAPDKGILAQMLSKAREVDGVLQVHDLRARHSGPQIFAELHIVVEPDLTVREGHDIARNVKYSLLDNFADITRVIIHVDPELKVDDAPRR
ncbi:MAG: cation transporter [bacterium]|nr:cation transporter [bacterium]